MNASPRMMIYCQDSFGLGHLRRNVNIAHAVSRLRPDASILFVADSPLAPFFSLPRNSDFVKLPTLVKVSKGDWEVHRLSQVSPDAMIDIRSELIKETASSFDPDVVLVDHMPHGACGELVPCLETLRKRGRARILVGLRDILGAPEDILPQWRERGAFELLERFYHQILVYGEQEVYDLGAAYSFPPELLERIRYCGYVSAPQKRYPRAAAKLSAEFETEFGRSRPFTTLVMGGGGSDAYPFMDTLLDAVVLLGPDIEFNTYMLTGPFMPPNERQALVEKARGLPVVVKRFRDDSAKILQLADLVVSMAGYNTTCEILQSARRAVLIPREGPSVEQTMRTGLLEKRGLLRAIHPRYLTAETLADALVRELRTRPRTRGNGKVGQPVDLKGAARAAQRVLECAGFAEDGVKRAAS